MTMATRRLLKPALPIAPPPKPLPIMTFLVCVVVGSICFYLGNIMGMHSGINHGAGLCDRDSEELKSDRDRLSRGVFLGVYLISCIDDYLTLPYRLHVVELARAKEVAIERGVPRERFELEMVSANQPRFPSTVSKFAHGQVLIDRDDFASTFDMGVPVDPTISGNEQVLLLYNRELSLPKDRNVANAARKQGEIPIAASALEATENCDYLNVILTDFKESRAQCWALMGQYEAFHIQKFMRLPDTKGEMARHLPLKLVNRGAQKNGRKSTKPPPAYHTLEYWKTLAPY